MQEPELKTKKYTIDDLKQLATGLLCDLIRIPSFSGAEEETATLLTKTLQREGIICHRHKNNVWARNAAYDPGKPTLLLNSHHDTVRPNAGWTVNPFEPVIYNNKLHGLGSNDAGGTLAALLATFVEFYQKEDLPFNLVFAATAEEENSGKNGIECLLPLLGPIDAAIVGEPTGMNMAVAEKGLLVLDIHFAGKAGHAARKEGENAMYKAADAIQWIRNYQFEKVSSLLGPVQMTATCGSTTNQAHNVVPDQFQLTVDIRVNDQYTLEEVLQTVQENVAGQVTARSLRLRPSNISDKHPLVKAGQRLGLRRYGSPTTSDMTLMNFPTLKLGPGESARSHTADEFILPDELTAGIETYIRLLNELCKLNWDEN